MGASKALTKMSVYVFPSNQPCDRSCRHCGFIHHGKRDRRIELEQLDDFMRVVRRNVDEAHACISGFGEPLHRHNLPEIITILKESTDEIQLVTSSPNPGNKKELSVFEASLAAMRAEDCLILSCNDYLPQMEERLYGALNVWKDIDTPKNVAIKCLTGNPFSRKIQRIICGLVDCIYGGYKPEMLPVIESIELHTYPHRILKQADTKHKVVDIANFLNRETYRDERGKTMDISWDFVGRIGRGTNLKEAFPVTKKVCPVFYGLHHIEIHPDGECRLSHLCPETLGNLNDKSTMEILQNAESFWHINQKWLSAQILNPEINPCYICQKIRNN